MGDNGGSRLPVEVEDQEHPPQRDEKGRFVAGNLYRFKDESGNPIGMKSASALVSYALNALIAHGLTAAELTAIQANEDERWQYRVAAKLMLNALVNDSGVPVGSKLDPGKDFDRICDRTGGKPKTAVDVSTDGQAIRFVLKPPDVVMQAEEVEDGGDGTGDSD